MESCNPSLANTSCIIPANTQHGNNVVTTSLQRPSRHCSDVVTTLLPCCVFAGVLANSVDPDQLASEEAN